MDTIEVDPDSYEMLKELGFEKIPGLQQTNPTPNPYRAGGRN